MRRANMFTPYFRVHNHAVSDFFLISFKRAEAPAAAESPRGALLTSGATLTVNTKMQQSIAWIQQELDNATLDRHCTWDTLRHAQNVTSHLSPV